MLDTLINFLLIKCYEGEDIAFRKTRPGNHFLNRSLLIISFFIKTVFESYCM